MHKVIDIKNFLDNKFELVPKRLGVELVELGFLKYTKLTSENYYYWWYEVDNKNELNKNNYTFNWNDLVHTSKMNLIKQFIIHHKPSENIYRLINAVLNIDASICDGIDKNTKESEFKRLINFYYKNKV